ncbi:MAG: hypothetical protein WB780_15800 [Candidatus Acidiferrales bacterium]
MRHAYRLLSSLFFMAALISPVAITGCAARASYRVYDPYYNDYHSWDHHEDVYYQRWEADTRRDHRDFDKRDKDEQKEYWNWRHNHQ